MEDVPYQRIVRLSKVSVGDDIYVPLVRSRRARRAYLTEEEWEAVREPAASISYKNWVCVCSQVDGDPVLRYFRPHVGRTWRDCIVPQVDRIFGCQEFTLHDRFMLFGCMGRTLQRA